MAIMKTSTKTHWSKILVTAGACSEGLAFARKFPSFQHCWDACENPEWLFWWVGKCKGNSEDFRKAAVRCACEIAQFVLPIFEKAYPKDNRPRKAIETALAWTEGKASIDDVRKAEHAAYYVAAYAADYAASAAVYAAHAAVYAARASNNTPKILKIIKKHYPSPPEYK